MIFLFDLYKKNFIEHDIIHFNVLLTSPFMKKRQKWSFFSQNMAILDQKLFGEPSNDILLDQYQKATPVNIVSFVNN